jgi:hypothetical protein
MPTWENAASRIRAPASEENDASAKQKAANATAVAPTRENDPVAPVVMPVVIVVMDVPVSPETRKKSRNEIPAVAAASQSGFPAAVPGFRVKP